MRTETDQADNDAYNNKAFEHHDHVIRAKKNRFFSEKISFTNP